VPPYLKLSGAPGHKGTATVIEHHGSWFQSSRNGSWFQRSRYDLSSSHMPHASCFCYLGRSDRLQPLQPGKRAQEETWQAPFPDSSFLRRSCFRPRRHTRRSALEPRSRSRLLPHNDHIYSKPSAESYLLSKNKHQLLRPFGFQSRILRRVRWTWSIQSLTAILVAPFLGCAGAYGRGRHREDEISQSSCILPFMITLSSLDCHNPVYCCIMFDSSTAYL